MPKVDLESIEQVNRTGYPPPFDKEVAGRWYRRLAPATGLTDFGVSHVVLKPGAWSSQRHWQIASDEFVHVLQGEVVLVTDGGEEVLRAGDSAGFRAGEPDGHHLQNRSERDAVILEVGTRLPGDGCFYSDVDMMVLDDGPDGHTRRDGTPYARADDRTDR